MILTDSLVIDASIVFYVVGYIYCFRHIAWYFLNEERFSPVGTAILTFVSTLFWPAVAAGRFVAKNESIFVAEPKHIRKDRLEREYVRAKAEQESMAKAVLDDHDPIQEALDEIVAESEPEPEPPKYYEIAEGTDENGQHYVGYPSNHWPPQKFSYETYLRVKKNRESEERQAELSQLNHSSSYYHEFWYDEKSSLIDEHGKNLTWRVKGFS